MRSPLIKVGAILLGFSLIVGGLLSFTRHPEKTRVYNVWTEVGQSSWRGTRIESNGYCTTIYRGVRADTIFCMPHMITEVTGEADPSTPPQPTPPPEDSQSHEPRGAATNSSEARN